MNSGAKWAIGLGSGCLVVLVVCVVLAILAGRFVSHKSAEAEQRREAEREAFLAGMRARGFTNTISGQSVTIEEDIDQATIYEAQTFKLWGNCSTDLCVVAQTCEIFGTVEGTLIFEGQTLTIHPNGVIKGDLEVDAQTVERHGEVHGTVSGSYQVFKD